MFAWLSYLKYLPVAAEVGLIAEEFGTNPNPVQIADATEQAALAVDPGLANNEAFQSFKKALAAYENAYNNSISGEVFRNPIVFPNGNKAFAVISLEAVPAESTSPAN